MSVTCNAALAAPRPSGGRRAGKGAQAKANKELARARRDAAAVPELVFWIESFEAACLKLSKAAKCSVIKGLKRTVNRDFRIKVTEAATA